MIQQQALQHQIDKEKDKEKKLGHRSVKDGVVHYKKISSKELKNSIQLGIVHFINEQNRNRSPFNIERDILVQDFQVVDTIQFPHNGSASQPPHDYNDFKLKIYAPYGFKYLRKCFKIDEMEFVNSLGHEELNEVSNPGASGSVFYKTYDDKFILKTVQHQEAEFLRTLLPGYTLSLFQKNMVTFLPKIYGLFCYQKLELASMLSDKTNIRVIIMNNILPSDVPIHEKYDLKGSSYKRKASESERAKSSPTFKDNDFVEIHPGGITLDERTYEWLTSNMDRDCQILESFEIMDYSLLLAIHNLDKQPKPPNSALLEAYYEAKMNQNEAAQLNATDSQLNVNLMMQMNRSSRGGASSSGSSNAATTATYLTNLNAVPALSGKNERLLLFFGIIDILQSYRLKKRLEHTFKAMFHDGNAISVTDPKFYKRRFLDFLRTKVFHKKTFRSQVSPVPKQVKSSIKRPSKVGNDELSSRIASPTPSDYPERVYNMSPKQFENENEEEDDNDSGINSLKTRNKAASQLAKVYIGAHPKLMHSQNGNVISAKPPRVAHEEPFSGHEARSYNTLPNSLNRHTKVVYGDEGKLDKESPASWRGSNFTYSNNNSFKHDIPINVQQNTDDFKYESDDDVHEISYL